VLVHSPPHGVNKHISLLICTILTSLTQRATGACPVPTSSDKLHQILSFGLTVCSNERENDFKFMFNYSKWVSGDSIFWWRYMDWQKRHVVVLLQFSIFQ
jgi:hypothetical protein